jgi:hypothetical protein
MSAYEQVRNATYFRNVLGSIINSGLGPKDKLMVQFGETGIGFAPHYHIFNQEKKVYIRINGLNHKPFRKDTEMPFDQVTSEPFTYKDITEMLRRCLAPIKNPG